MMAVILWNLFPCFTYWQCYWTGWLINDLSSMSYCIYRNMKLKTQVIQWFTPWKNEYKRQNSRSYIRAYGPWGILILQRNEDNYILVPISHVLNHFPFSGGFLDTCAPIIFKAGKGECGKSSNSYSFHPEVAHVIFHIWLDKTSYLVIPNF